MQTISIVTNKWLPGLRAKEMTDKGTQENTRE